MASPSLNAVYTRLPSSSSAPTSSDSKTFTHPLPTAPGAATTESRTAALAALREASVQLQSEVNVFLTAKMDEDNAAAAAAAVGGQNARKADDDAKEEENYGEEVVGDD